MQKDKLIEELKSFKERIQDFHKKRWNYVINIPTEIVEGRVKENSSYKENELITNSKLREAIYSAERSKISKERKEEVYFVDKSNLKQVYGGLKKYILLFGENPGNNNKSCYDVYFLNDDYNFEKANFDSITSDIDIIIGRLNSYSEKEFIIMLSGKKEKNLWKTLNPIYWLFNGGFLIWKHKWISAIIIFIVGLILTVVFTPLIDTVTKPIQELLSGALLKQ